MTFEQELYNNFNVCFSRPFFITFTGDVSPCVSSCDAIVWNAFFVDVVNMSGPSGSDPYQTTRNVAIRLSLLVEFSKAVPSHLSSSFSCVRSQTCQVGLNFANEEETKRFRGHLVELLERRQRKSGTCWPAAASLRKMT